MCFLTPRLRMHVQIMKRETSSAVRMLLQWLLTPLSQISAWYKELEGSVVISAVSRLRRAVCSHWYLLDAIQSLICRGRGERIERAGRRSKGRAVWSNRKVSPEVKPNLGPGHLVFFPQ
jgi:hypothetical protein